jgi:tetratricopeptide (TPR) repeat protein
MPKIIKLILTLIIIGLLGFAGYLVFFDLNSTISKSPGIPPIKVNSNTAENKTNNPEIDSLLAEAKTLFQQKKYQEALQTYVKAYELDKSSNLAIIGVAEVYFELDRQDLVQQNLQNALLKGDLTYDGKILVVKSHLLKQDLPNARQAYQSIQPESNQKLLLGFYIDSLSSNLKAGREKLETIIKSAANDEPFQVASKLKESLAIYDTFLDSPKSYLFALIGKTLIEQNQFVIARPFLFGSIEDKNDYRDSWLMLGYSYLLSNKNEDAQKALERAKQIDPYNPEVYFYLGLAQQKNSQNDLALDNLKKASSFGFRSSKDNLVQIANSLYLEKNYVESSDYFIRASQVGSLSLEEYTKVVWMNLEQLKNPSLAVTVSLQALQNYPTTPMANNLVGWAQLGADNLTEANKFLKLALEQDPNLDAAYLNLGFLSLRQNNPTEALNLFQKAVELGNKNRSSSIAERAQAEINKINSVSSNGTTTR